MKTKTSKKTHSQEIAERCVAEAQDMLGAGWRHVSVEIRRGLVMSRIIAVIFGQDPSIGADRILAYQHELVDAADAILGYE